MVEFVPGILCVMFNSSAMRAFAAARREVAWALC
jgi:hypothetical protein